MFDFFAIDMGAGKIPFVDFLAGAAPGERLEAMANGATFTDDSVTLDPESRRTIFFHASNK